MPKISVIIPVYNVEAYLHRCVDSILDQTFPDFELILVDDGSPDSCPAICDEYARRGTRVHVIHQENGGLSAARNAGIDWAFANSDSQWLSFIDSDDFVHPRFLEILLNLAEQYHVLVSTCQFRSFSDFSTSSFPESCTESEVRLLGFSEYYATPGVWSVSACNKLYQKALFQGLRFPLGKLMEDAHTTYLALHKAGKIAISDSPLYFYYLRENSIMHQKYRLKYLDGLDACKEQFRFFSERQEPLNAQTAFHQLVNSYASHCKSLSEESGEEFRAKRKELVAELRQLLEAHRDWVSIGKDATPLEVAFPKRMWCYWTYMGLRSKFTKK